MANETDFLIQVEAALNDVKFNDMTADEFEQRVYDILGDWKATLPRKVPIRSVPAGMPVVYDGHLVDITPRDKNGQD
ncbi:MAG: hypothetical protein AAGD43_06775 [Pseudomonadota bacterium]